MPLKLWRNVGERIVMADGEIVVTVLTHNEDAARLAIEAPVIYPDNPRAEHWVRVGESMKLGERIVLHVIEVERGGRRGVRFEIDAPREIRIDHQKKNPNEEQTK